MEWMNKNLFEGYVLVGDLDDHVVRLYISHPGGVKIIKEKHMTQHDSDNCDLDNIRRFFSKQISKIESLSMEQLQLQCGTVEIKEIK